MADFASFLILLDQAKTLVGYLDALRSAYKWINEEAEVAKEAARGPALGLGASSGKIAEAVARLERQLAVLQGGQNDLLRGQSDLGLALAEIKQRITEQSVSLERIGAQLAEMQARQIDEIARQKREMMAANFLLSAKKLLTKIHDPTVRWLFAKIMVDACYEQQISPTTFQHLTNKIEAENILEKLIFTLQSATPSEIADAAFFIQKYNLLTDIASYRDRYERLLTAARNEQQKWVSTRELHAAKIIENSTGEDAKHRESRHSHRNAYAVFATVSFVSCAAIAAIPIVSVPVAAPLALAIVSLMASWLESDTYRKCAVCWHAMWVREMIVKENESRQKIIALVEKTQDYAARHRCEVPFEFDLFRQTSDPSRGASLTLADVLNAVQNKVNGWRLTHPEIALVYGPRTAPG